ncbi:MAG TPA: tripartite tricarboxylate transporter TctB family protein [Gammaproteobacteria bacterium]
MTSSDKEPTRLRDRLVWEALAWLGFTLVVYLFTRDFDAPLPSYQLGAAFWPQVVLVITAIAAITLLVSRFVRGVETDDADDGPAHLEDIPAPSGGIPIITLAMFILPLIWVFALHQIGFLLSTPFFLIGFTWLIGIRRLRTLLGFSLGFYAVLVVVFYKLIFTPLPMGAGWFHSISGEIIALIQ